VCQLCPGDCNCTAPHRMLNQSESMRLQLECLAQVALVSGQPQTKPLGWAAQDPETFGNPSGVRRPRGLEFVWTGPYSGHWREPEPCGVPDCYVCTGRCPDLSRPEP